MKVRSKPKAIIFDLDGVIVDTMPYHFLAWYEALRPEGVRVSCFDVYSREGERWQKTLKELLLEAGIRPTEKKLRIIFERRKKIFKRNFKRHIFKGAEEFLSCLKAKEYLLGLVTGTPLVEVKKILSRKTLCLFDCVVSGDSVKMGKPHPEPFLLAAQRLNVPPGRCFVIENAPHGIESAKKAGMFCAAITTSLPRQYLRQADAVVDSFKEIMGLVEKSCARRK